MPEQNIENQPEPKKNPTRENTKVVNPDGVEEEGEKRFGEGDSPRRKPEINPGEIDKKEIDLDRDGASGSNDGETLQNKSPETGAGRDVRH